MVHFEDRRWSGPWRGRERVTMRRMRRWELAIALDRRGGQPIFLQIASALSQAIRSRRLKDGEPLPGTRELAGQLGLNRNTIVAAYEELHAEGLVQTRVGGGTFVVAPPPELRALPQPVQPTYALG